MPSNMILSIRSGVVNYNNKILISDREFVLGKNDKVTTLELAKISHKVVLRTTITPQKQTITHEEEKLPWYFLWLGPSDMVCFSPKRTKPTSGCSVSHLPLETLTCHSLDYDRILGHLPSHPSNSLHVGDVGAL